MALYTACAWCQTRNDIGKARMNGLSIYCRKCGHRADVSQRRCDCRVCLGSSEQPSPANHEPEQSGLFDALAEEAKTEDRKFLPE